MSFKLQPKPTFWAKVSISVPGQDKPAVIDVEFRHKTKGELRDFFDAIPVRDDLDMITEIVCGWRGVDTEFSVDALGELIDNYPQSALGIITAYQSAIFEAKRKN